MYCMLGYASVDRYQHTTSVHPELRLYRRLKGPWTHSSRLEVPDAILGANTRPLERRSMRKLPATSPGPIADHIEAPENSYPSCVMLHRGCC